MSILVPIDSSEESTQALPRAIELAREAGGPASELILASIGELPEVPRQADEARSALSRRLSSVASGISEVPVRTRIELAGDPARGLLEIAREEQVERIVIASHERGPFESLVDGSITDDLKDALEQIPVTVVPIT